MHKYFSVAHIQFGIIGHKVCVFYILTFPDNVPSRVAVLTQFFLNVQHAEMEELFQSCAGDTSMLLSSGKTIYDLY